MTPLALADKSRCRRPIFEVAHAYIPVRSRRLEDGLGRRGRAAARARAARRRSAVAPRSEAEPASDVAGWAAADASRDDPCVVLRDLAAAGDAAAAAVRAEVERLRSADTGWPAIAKALGVTRQAVRKRYGELAKEKDDRGR